MGRKKGVMSLVITSRRFLLLLACTAAVGALKTPAVAIQHKTVERAHSQCRKSRSSATLPGNTNTAVQFGENGGQRWRGSHYGSKKSWLAAVEKHEACELRTSQFSFTPSNLMLAAEVVTLSSIGQALTFVKEKTGIPLQFVFSILPSGVSAPQVRSNLVDGEGSSSLRVGGDPGDRSSTSDNDDFELRLGAADGSGVKAYGAGFELVGNDKTAGETVSILGEGGVCLGQFSLANYSSTDSQFIGFVASAPIFALVFDEDDGKDDVGIRTLHFAYCEQDSAHFLVSSGVWLGFIIFVSVAITLDVTCVKPASLMELRVAAGWSLVWVGLAMGFAGFVYYSLGSRASALFITGYFVEESLSVDNLVVFVLIFKQFKTPTELQHRALLYGVLLSIALRVVFIFFGTWLLSRFRVMLLFFGGFLVYTGYKMAAMDGGAEDIGAIRRGTMRLLAYFGVDVTEEWDTTGSLALVKVEGKDRWQASPMLPLFVSIGLCDIMFAFDSIPAILGITEDFFLVVSSNAFAVLGLRSMYWCLAALHSRFDAIQHALSAALVCVGIKMASGYFEYNLSWWVYLACAAAVAYISVRTEKKDDAEDVELGNISAQSSTSIGEASTSTTSSVNKASKRSSVAADSLV